MRRNSERRLPVAGMWVALLLVMASPAPSRADAPAPSNDSHRSALEIEGLPFTYSADVSGATYDDGPPTSPCAQGILRNVWFSYRPTDDVRRVGLHTVGSSYDTVVSVWAGTVDSGWELVDCNDDVGDGLESRLIIDASPATPLLIEVGTRSSGAADLTLELVVPRTAGMTAIGLDTLQGYGLPPTQAVLDVDVECSESVTMVVDIALQQAHLSTSDEIAIPCSAPGRSHRVALPGTPALAPGPADVRMVAKSRLFSGQHVVTHESRIVLTPIR